MRPRGRHRPESPPVRLELTCTPLSGLDAPGDFRASSFGAAGAGPWCVREHPGRGGWAEALEARCRDELLLRNRAVCGSLVSPNATLIGYVGDVSKPFFIAGTKSKLPRTA